MKIHEKKPFLLKKIGQRSITDCIKFQIQFFQSLKRHIRDVHSVAVNDVKSKSLLCVPCNKVGCIQLNTFSLKYNGPGGCTVHFPQVE